MKIKKIEFKKHNVFKNHCITFGDVNIPQVSFLVGNNGSGKTKVLDMVFQALSNPFSYSGDFVVSITILCSEKEKTDFKLSESEIIYTINKESGNNHHEVKDKEGNSVSLNIQEVSKVVFSTIEVNFNEQNVNSVTSKNIDDVLNPREKSQNLATEIPQLLVDIYNLDATDAKTWFEKNKDIGYPSPFPKDVGGRLERFTNAFHRIYEGEKTFSSIKNDNDTKKITFTDARGEEIGLNELSTGEKQIIYRVGYILKNLGNIHGGIILIDEPEISLHPTWQIKLKDFLLEIFKGYDVQIIIATHSPYIFKNLDETNESCIKIDRLNSESKKISMVFPGVPYTPSVNLINYLAYGIVSELLHIELYTFLQIREKRDKITNSWNRVTNTKNNDGIEDWLQDVGGGNQPVKQTFVRAGKSGPTKETIMTWIRNKIHHHDESARPVFTESDLKDSIEEMIKLLKKI